MQSKPILAAESWQIKLLLPTVVSKKTNHRAAGHL
jgi:hypothetical protein